MDIKQYIIDNQPEKAFVLLSEWLKNHPDDVPFRVEILKMCVLRTAMWRELRVNYPLEALYNLAAEIVALGAEGQIYYELAQLHEYCFDIDKSHEYFLKYAEASRNNSAEHLLALMCVGVNANYNGLLSEDEYIKINNAIYDYHQKAVTAVRSFTPTGGYFKTIRIGLISRDFYNHPIGMFISSLFPTINPLSQVEIYCYYTHDAGRKDMITEYIRDNCDKFVFAGRYSNAALGQQLLDDKLDIIIDLNNQSYGNRLDLLAQRFAPVQMTWMGFPFTTATPNIDYAIGDTLLDPPDNSTERFLTEKVIRMDSCYMCYGINLSGVQAAEPPCLRNGYITFGNMSAPNKHSKHTLKLWKEVMDALPTAVLHVRIPVSDAFAIGKYRERLARNGLDLKRIRIKPYEELDGYFNAYNDIDIMLDTAPYNGCTILFDSFKMGTPTVSLKGAYRQSRHCTFLQYVGLGDLIAENDREYVQKALQLAGDYQRIKNIKKTLPGVLKDSVLYDKSTFQNAFERMVRRAYLTYCFTHPLPIDVHERGNDVKLLLGDCLRAESIIGTLANAGEPVEHLQLLTAQYGATAGHVLTLIPKQHSNIASVLEVIDIIKKALRMLETSNDTQTKIGFIKPVNEMLALCCTAAN